MLGQMPLVYYIYAAILFGGGIMGTVKSGKPSSLMGSAVFAVVAIVAGVLTARNVGSGLVVGLLNAAAVAAFFVYRYLKTGNAMPAFPSIALSLIVLALTVFAMTGRRNLAG